MATAFEIPLQAQGQYLAVTLAGVVYNLYVYWNAANSSWCMDISDSSKNPLVGGIPLITGVDLLAPFKYLGIGGQLQVRTDNTPFNVPGINDLGKTGHLYFIAN